ncbi:sensory rhodopsin transducer [Stutzerimonas azotifigens]|uniref:sensory rhodopsin transducer n=1 Tax=Stutzerimonas azotifigens TaxID=291995 RepID=UPI000416F0BC|nr:sensory rhodopsin transducer [Stutzerimonas azotifigens]
MTIGQRHWVIAEGYLPPFGPNPDDPTLRSHESACILNPGDREAQIELTLYFSDREPAGPYRLRVPPRRTLHMRFDDLADPAPVPRETDYASVFVSDVPVVVQHTRLDARPQALALMTTLAYGS